MARKRILGQPALQSWEDVNNALREIAENQIAVGDIEAEMQKQIIGIKMIAEQETKPHHDRISRLERDIKEFVDNHRSDMGEQKSLVFNFGEVSYRQSTTITVPTSLEKLSHIIRTLKARGMQDCIVTKETVDKNVLRKYGEDTVNAVGAVYRKKDEFGYNVYIDKLERLHPGNL